MYFFIIFCYLKRIFDLYGELNIQGIFVIVVTIFKQGVMMKEVL
ncbi:hypothetical protein DOT_5937 [Desulfosporosinus sp. OT]|nr:hypothetical protein DOT_5937 [Desulfosporosinus sp. OT]ODA41366.1 hypothetical protein DSBG_1809 [Desulfosporosinus sp. BG]